MTNIPTLIPEKIIYLRGKSLVYERKKNPTRNCGIIIFFSKYFCILSDVFGDKGRKKCCFGTFYDFLSKTGVVKSAKTEFFTTPGTIELIVNCFSRSS